MLSVSGASAPAPLVGIAVDDFDRDNPFSLEPAACEEPLERFSGSQSAVDLQPCRTTPVVTPASSLLSQ
jgi:hypothetical protein